MNVLEYYQKEPVFLRKTRKDKNTISSQNQEITLHSRQARKDLTYSHETRRNLSIFPRQKRFFAPTLPSSMSLTTCFAGALSSNCTLLSPTTSQKELLDELPPRSVCERPNATKLQNSQLNLSTVIDFCQFLWQGHLLGLPSGGSHCTFWGISVEPPFNAVED